MKIKSSTILYILIAVFLIWYFSIRKENKNEIQDEKKEPVILKDDLNTDLSPGVEDKHRSYLENVVPIKSLVVSIYDFNSSIRLSPVFRAEHFNRVEPVSDLNSRGLNLDKINKDLQNLMCFSKGEFVFLNMGGGSDNVTRRIISSKRYDDFNLGLLRVGVDFEKGLYLLLVNNIITDEGIFMELRRFYFTHLGLQCSYDDTTLSICEASDDFKNYNSLIDILFKDDPLRCTAVYNYLIRLRDSL